MSTFLFAAAVPDLLEFVVRLLHVGAAVVAAGGAFFQWAALHPTLATLSPEARAAVREPLVGRWSGVVFVAIALLLISGFVNFLVYKVPTFRGAANAGLYHGVFGVKFLLALMAFHAASVLVLPGSRGSRYRDRAGFWLSYLVAIFAVILLLGVLLGRLTPQAAGVGD